MKAHTIKSKREIIKINKPRYHTLLQKEAELETIKQNNLTNIVKAFKFDLDGKTCYLSPLQAVELRDKLLEEFPILPIPTFEDFEAITGKSNLLNIL